jgi:hypothetical protein
VASRQPGQPGAGSYRPYHRRIRPPNRLRSRPALGLAVIAVVVVAAAVTVLAVADGGGPEAVPTAGDRPEAPWRAASPVARKDVAPAWVTAWDRAHNRARCRLLFPLDGGPELTGATATEQPTPGDNGWDVFLTGRAGTVEVLGLFGPATKVDASPDTPVSTMAWSDGSVARYAVDVGRAAPGTFDVDSSPFEAVLTVPGQACTYRIYDTLGRAHLEATFDRLRFAR